MRVVDFDRIRELAYKKYCAYEHIMTAKQPKKQDKLWDMVVDGSNPDPLELYQTFIEVFLLGPTFDKISWNENITVGPFWAKKGEDIALVNDHIIHHKSSDESVSIEYHFRASGPSKIYPREGYDGWRIAAEFVRSGTKILCSLRFCYPTKEYTDGVLLSDETCAFKSIQKSQFELTCFLWAVEELFGKEKK